MPKNPPSAFHVEMGRRIRIARVAAGLTQKVVARELGMTFQAVQKIESGKTKLEAQAAVRLATLFDVDVRVLLGIRALPRRLYSPRRMFS